jgi:hypothetical protein
MGPCDFFITYNNHDGAWAEWIARALERAGYHITLQAWDFRPGQNFMANMNRALGDCRHTIGVLSPEYLQSVFARAEWTAAYRQTILGKERGFIPIRVALCDPEPLLGPVAYIDLVGLDEAQARDQLLDGVADSIPRRPRGPFPGAPSSP